jgi:hypothetical protein
VGTADRVDGPGRHRRVQDRRVAQDPGALVTEHDPEIAEAARWAASAPPDADCAAVEHGTYQAYRHARCRCRATVQLVSVIRRQRGWDSEHWARKSLERLIERNSVRPEVVELLLAGRRREVQARQVEKTVAFRRAVELWGENVGELARRLDYTSHEVRRRLRILRRTEEDT